MWCGIEGDVSMSESSLQGLSMQSRQAVDLFFAERNGEVGTQELVELAIETAIRLTGCCILQRVNEAKLRTLYVAFGHGISAREAELMQGLIQSFENELLRIEMQVKKHPHALPFSP